MQLFAEFTESNRTPGLCPFVVYSIAFYGYYLKHMKTHTIAKIIILVFSLTASAQAQQEKNLGVGVILGEPSGLTINKFIAPSRSIDLGVGWSFAENESLHLHADYLFHRFDRVTTSNLNDRIPLYYGLGLRVKLKSDEDDKDAKNFEDEMIGIRIPIGLSYFLDDQPIEFFAEIIPIIELTPDFEFDISAALGGRYYF